MNYNKTKATKRFTFGINRNSTSKKAGSNIVTIETKADAGVYNTSGAALTMTVREAQALQSFLNESLSFDDSSSSVKI